MADRAPPTTALPTLIVEWRKAAEVLRKYGASEQAIALESCVQDSLAALQRAACETLTPAEAAVESGYTSDSITRLMREGAIPNVGTKRRPRARRSDLPRKAIATRTELALLPDSANSATVAPGLLRAAVSSKLTGGRRA
jgi:hypothetical protein